MDVKRSSGAYFKLKLIISISMFCVYHSVIHLFVMAAPQKVTTEVSVYDDIFLTESGLIPLPESAIELEHRFVIPMNQCRFPFRIASDSHGNIYVSDKGNGVVYKLSQGGDIRLQIGSKGRKKGQLLAPYNLLAEHDSLIVHDIEKKQLEYFDFKGTYLISQKIPELIDITSNGNGRLYVAHHVQDKGSSLVNVYYPDGKKSAFGKPLSFTHSMRELNSRSLVLDENGNLFVAFTYFPIIRKYSAQGKLVNEYRIENPIMEAKENYNLKRIGEGVAKKTLRVGYRAIIIDIENFGGKLYLLSHVPRLEIIEMDVEGEITATYWKNFQEVYETNDLLVQKFEEEIRFYIAHSFAPKHEIDVFQKKTKKYQEGLEGEIEKLTEEIDANPKYFSALNNRGVARHRLGDYEGAIEDISKAIELNPESSLAHNNRGLSKVKIRDLTGAVNDFTKAIELDPKSALAYFNRGIALVHIKHFVEAIEDFEQASLLDDNLVSKAQEQIRYCMSQIKKKAID